MNVEQRLEAEFFEELSRGSFPCTVIPSRYTGVYSRGIYLAFNVVPWKVPTAVYADDIACDRYFNNIDVCCDDDGELRGYSDNSKALFIGVSNTMQGAVDNLKNLCAGGLSKNAKKTM